MQTIPCHRYEYTSVTFGLPAQGSCEVLMADALTWITFLLIRWRLLSILKPLHLGVMDAAQHLHRCLQLCWLILYTDWKWGDGRNFPRSSNSVISNNDGDDDEQMQQALVECQSCQSVCAHTDMSGGLIRRDNGDHLDMWEIAGGWGDNIFRCLIFTYFCSPVNVLSHNVKHHTYEIKNI